MTVETRHHIEYQANDNRFSEVRRTSDYEEFLSRYAEEDEKPTLEQWQKEMVSLHATAAGGQGRVRVWLVTRTEIELETLPNGLAQARLENGIRDELVEKYAGSQNADSQNSEG